MHKIAFTTGTSHLECLKQLKIRLTAGKEGTAVQSEDKPFLYLGLIYTATP
jgi:hypothetical protein